MNNKITMKTVDNITDQLKYTSNKVGDVWILLTIFKFHSAKWYAKFGNSEIIDYTYD